MSRPVLSFFLLLDKKDKKLLKHVLLSVARKRPSSHERCNRSPADKILFSHDNRDVDSERVLWTIIRIRRKFLRLIVDWSIENSIQVSASVRPSPVQSRHNIDKRIHSFQRDSSLPLDMSDLNQILDEILNSQIYSPLPDEQADRSSEIDLIVHRL